MKVRGGGILTTKGFLFEISGGHPALDFANTVDQRPTEAPKELLRSYANLVSWGEQAGLLRRPEAQRLRQKAARRPKEAQAALGRATGLREALFAIFTAVAGGRPVPEDALDRLNAALPRALAQLRVSPSGRRFAWTWNGRTEDLERVLWPVARAAAELLVSGKLSRVRQCAAETCAWLFIDRSKNATRRWCDMSVCGNRAKVRRFYERARAGR